MEIANHIGLTLLQIADMFHDEESAYQGLPMSHESVKHSVSEFVRDQAHMNGMESFWTMLKRGHYGTHHKLSPKHLNRYVTEFERRHNVREADIVRQMGLMVDGKGGKWLRYEGHIADNGLPSGARL